METMKWKYEDQASIMENDDRVGVPIDELDRQTRALYSAKRYAKTTAKMLIGLHARLFALESDDEANYCRGSVAANFTRMVRKTSEGDIQRGYHPRGPAI